MANSIVVVYFGLRYLFPAGSDVTALENRSDRRILSAHKVKLKTYWGRLTDGDYHFLLVGTPLGNFGETESICACFTPEALDLIMKETRQKLEAAGFSDVPALQIQLEADY